ncbi:MAG: methyltransferase [Pseudonocardiaceae bacterium]
MAPSAAAASAADRGRLVQLVFGLMAGEVVGTAARLGLADLIGDAECIDAELAEVSGTDPGALARLLRAMAALELLVETRPGRFRLAGAGGLLRTDRRDSMHDFVRMFSEPAMLASWRELDDAMRTGRTVFDEVFGIDFFAYLAADPALSERFNAAMRQGTQLTARLLPTHYEFARFHTVADIGGGDGILIAGVLREHPTLRGVLFDTAKGLAQADRTLAAAGTADRCRTEIGDFFTAVPEGADLYLLKSVVHDWDDERAGAILENCRQVIPDHGQLLIIEPVLPEVVNGSIPPTMYLSDLNMLVNIGGRERTRADFEDLCHRSGFTLTGITPLPPPAAFSLIEAVPTWTE